MDKQIPNQNPSIQALEPEIDHAAANERLRRIVAVCKDRIDKTGVANTRDYRRAFARGAPVVFATRMNDMGNGFSYHQELLPIYRQLSASVGAILLGVPFPDLERVCGVSNEELNLIATLDRTGYGLLYRGACGERRRTELIFRKRSLAENQTYPDSHIVHTRGHEHILVTRAVVPSEFQLDFRSGT